MKKNLLLIVLLLLCSGCATACITTKSVDGKVVECSGSYFSIFRDIDALNISACGGRGNSSGSKVNSAMAQELFKALLTVP